jgi:hypothetical protein
MKWKSTIPPYIDPLSGGQVSGLAIFRNWENGWDHVFPHNAGGPGPLDPVWTDPGNNVRIRRSEIIRLGL